MNKYNIDEYVFFIENDFSNPKATKITMGQILEIKRIHGDGGHSQIIYTVKCLYAVNHEKTRWEGLKSMDEGCLERDFMVLESIINKVQRKYYREGINKTASRNYSRKLNK